MNHFFASIFDLIVHGTAYVSKVKPCPGIWNLYTGPTLEVNSDAMRPFIVFGLLILLVAAPTVGAQGFLITESDSYVLIDENFVYEMVTLEYVISQNPENILQDNFQVYGTLSGENVRDLGGVLPFSVENIENGWSLIMYTLRDTLRAGDRSDVTVEFTRDYENIGGNRTYKIGYKWSTVPTSYQVIVKLPRGSSLTSTSESPSELYTENGGLYLRYSGVMMNNFQTYIVFTAPPREEAQPQEEGSQTEGTQTLAPYVGLAIVAVAPILAVWAVLRTRAVKPQIKVPKKAPRAAPPSDIKKILKILPGSERKVIEALLQKDNLTQIELCGRAGIPKSSMSRILLKLESKGLVRRVQYGMSKKVMLVGYAKSWRGKKSA